MGGTASLYFQTDNTQATDAAPSADVGKWTYFDVGTRKDLAVPQSSDSRRIRVGIPL